MHKAFPILLACLAVAACGKGDKQADALDRAAAQSDPAAATELHNRADAIRDGDGGDGNLSNVGSKAQDALQAAGAKAAANPADAALPQARPVDPTTGLTTGAGGAAAGPGTPPASAP